MWKKLDNNAEFEEATVWVQIFACLKNKKERSEGRKERSLETRIQFPRGVEGKMKYLIAEEEELEGKVKWNTGFLKKRNSKVKWNEMKYWIGEEEELEGKTKWNTGLLKKRNLKVKWNTWLKAKTQSHLDLRGRWDYQVFSQVGLLSIEINNFDGIRVKTFKEMAEVGREYLKNIYNDREEANAGISSSQFQRWSIMQWR